MQHRVPPPGTGPTRPGSVRSRPPSRSLLTAPHHPALTVPPPRRFQYFAHRDTGPPSSTQALARRTSSSAAECARASGAREIKESFIWRQRDRDGSVEGGRAEGLAAGRR